MMKGQTRHCGLAALRTSVKISVDLGIFQKQTTLNEDQNNSFRIWVDADACPAPIKEILFRTAKRREVHIVLVANQAMHVPRSKYIELVLVPHGADIADQKIVEMLQPDDIVITGDIPLAARVVEKSAIAVGVRGELFDDDSVHDRLASRDLMEQFRSAGIETSGPRPLGQKDIQDFANVLDRTLTRRLKR
jgi:uncharacterized protein YaiI (UPF0178 family)